MTSIDAMPGCDGRAGTVIVTEDASAGAASPDTERTSSGQIAISTERMRPRSTSSMIHDPSCPSSSTDPVRPPLPAPPVISAERISVSSSRRYFTAGGGPLSGDTCTFTLTESRSATLGTTGRHAKRR